MNRRIDDPRFDGAGVINVLFCACCFIAGAVVGIAFGAAL